MELKASTTSFPITNSLHKLILNGIESSVIPMDIGIGNWVLILNGIESANAKLLNLPKSPGLILNGIESCITVLR